MALSGARYSIAAGHYRGAVSDVGAGLAGLWYDDQPVTVDYPADSLPPMSSGTVLMPWPNRIRDGRYTFDGLEQQLPLTEPPTMNASHGLVKWERWLIAEQDEASVTLALDLVPQRGYPFELSMTIRYAVSDDSGLTVESSVRNVGSSAAPFGAGFHPYIDLGAHDLDHAELQIPAKTMLTVDDRKVPVGRLPVAGTPYELADLRPLGTLRLDHAFMDLTDQRAVVRVGGRSTEVWWDEKFGCVQVFTPPEITPGRRAIAIEPMSCPANAFNTGDGLVRLQPGDQWTGSWGIRLD
jgi:aldose 1-epimerase